MNDMQSGAAASPAAGEQTQGQPATTQAGANANPQQGAQSQGQAAQPPQGQEPQGQAAAQPQQGQQVMVPLTVVEALRDELKDSKVTVGQLKDQLQQQETMRQMGASFGQMPGNQQNTPAFPFQQPQNIPAAQQGGQGQPAQQAADLFTGLDDDDFVTVDQVKNALKSGGTSQQSFDPNALGAISQAIATLQVQVQDPNYENTIRTYLPEMITLNPTLAGLVQRAPNPLSAALAVAKMSPKYVQAQQAQQQGGQQTGQQQAQQAPTDPLSALQTIIDNAAKPGNPGAVGGAGGAVSGYERFRTMSDEDFNKEVDRVLGQGGLT